jgi:hypothetical protein
MMTMFADPGYVPKGHSYNTSHLSKTAAALLKFANDNQNSEKQHLKTYQCIIPLEFG